MTALYISEQAIRHNVQTIRTHSDSRIIAVVKENGYGVGLLPFYRILKSCGIDFFAVSSPAEALTLRRAGCEENILLLTPEFSVDVCEQLLANNIILMLHSREQAFVIREASDAAKVVPRIHLAIDTGLGRYGFPWNDLSEVGLCTEGMHLEGTYTHFATASRSCIRNIRRQHRRFRYAIRTLENQNLPVGLTHVSASRAFLSVGDLGCDAIRIGSLLLGCGAPSDADYERAVWLESSITQKTARQPGDFAGYDGTRIRKKNCTLGLISAGYRDGVFVGRTDTKESLAYQLLRSCFHLIMKKTTNDSVTFNGLPVPVLGKIGMHHMLLDLSGSSMLVGDSVRIRVNPLFVPDHIPRIFLPSA